MRVLAITSLFPNAEQPLSAPFNRQQFAALSKLCDLEVLATLPWFPGAGRLGGGSAAGRAVGVPASDVIDGMSVYHPRTLHLPVVGGAISGPLYAASLLPRIRRYRGRIDLLLGAWAYPDGWATVALAQHLGVPAVVKLHGTDMNVVAERPVPRRLLRTLLPRAAAVVAVSRLLRDQALALGVAPARAHIVMNGVDAELFHPRDRRRARTELGVTEDAELGLYVGNLKESKGVRDLLEAYRIASAENSRLQLAVVGDGAEAGAVRALAESSKGLLALGAQPLAAIPTWLAACDFLVLPSWNEGTPNAVLEALACGRRVVASRVGGIPDLLGDELLGELVPPREPRALAAALGRAAAYSYDPAEVARRGARGDWEASAGAFFEVLEGAVSGHQGPRRRGLPW